MAAPDSLARTLRDDEAANRRLRVAHKALGQILDAGTRASLPNHFMHWTITEWSIVGRCSQVGEDQANTRRAAFTAWADALRLDQRAERTDPNGIIELRSAAENWRGHHLLTVAVWADILPDLEQLP